MSRSLTSQSEEAKQKIREARTLSRPNLENDIKNYLDTLKSTELPSLTACAQACGITESNLYKIELRSADNSTLRLLLDKIRDMQKIALTERGLNKTYDSRMSIFLLKVHHGLKEDSPSLTQNNIFNVSPEILAEALELTKKNKDIK